MVIFISAVLLVVMQAVLPVPRQATDNATTHGENVTKQAENYQRPSAASMPVQNAPRPPADEEEATHIGASDPQQTIKIAEIPPVTIKGNGANFVALMFSGGLVVIGCIGVISALRTLRVIERQADEMAKQSGDIRKAAEAAQGSAIAAGKSADAALQQANHLVTSERAWLIIEPVDKTLAEAGFDFYWRVKNVGRTPAKLIETNARCEVAKTPINIPLTAEYVAMVAYGERLIAPGDSVEFRGYWEIRNSDRYSTYRGEFVTLNNLYLLAYGYAKYVTYEKTCESHFCSGLDGTMSIAKFRPRLDAPPEYTRHT